ncbi:glycosyltransferase [Paraclostridium bifermentans]|uniref:glycosyltransferase n=1 Tax=Paraclostridium bifermentans TaxID=1490 RepID=UPI00359C9D62
MVILLRCNDLNPDPRVDKYIKFYEENNIEYLLVGWNRSGEKINKKNTIYFEEKALYGARLKNIFKKIKWNMFLVKTLVSKKDEYNVIHACDFDTALPSLIMKAFNKRIVFDVFDWVGNSNLSGVPMIEFLIRNLEKLAANKSDHIIICDEGRKEQMHIKNNNIHVLPNIPYIDKNILRSLKEYKPSENINISYVGIFDRSRNIEQLLKLASLNKNITLNIAGFGALQEIVEEYTKKCENIVYYGKVDYAKSLEIMKNSDIIAAMYCKNIHNHIYAAPNKYYEALMLGKPIITTKGTLIGNNVEKNQVGFVIDEDFKFLEEIFENKELESLIKQYSENASLLWKNKFETYVEEFMQNEYYEILKGKEKI